MQNPLLAKLREQHPQLTPTQTKAVNKLYDAGSDGFSDVISIEKYANLCSVSCATDYRELNALREMGIPVQTGWGEGRGIGSHQITHPYPAGYRSAQVQLIKMHLHHPHLVASNYRSSL